MNCKSAFVFSIFLSAATIIASPQPPDSPYEKLKSYDYQNRTPVDAISGMIKQAHGNEQKLATIETNLDGVLDDVNATFAGKQEACRLLSIMGTSISVPSLSNALADEKTADIARYALERDPSTAAAKSLRLALATTTGKTRVGVINSLGDRGDPIAPGVIKKYIVSTDTVVSEAAIAALGKIGNPPAIALLKTLPETNVSAGHAMLNAAARLAFKGSNAAALAIYDYLSKTSRPPLIRAEAVRGLSVLNSPHAASVALAALRSEDPYLQEVAARVIGTIGTIAAVNPAMELWPHLQPKTQIVLLTAFADRRDKSALPIGFAAMESKDAALRAAGMRSSALIGGPTVVTRLVEVLVHGDGEDRTIAKECLSTMPGSDGERLLLQAARASNSETRVVLMAVLAERPTSGAMDVLTETAGDGDNVVAVPALQALGRVGKPQPFGQILKVLAAAKNDDVRDAARDAAGAIAPKVENHGAAQVFATYDDGSSLTKVALFPLLAEIGNERALSDLVKPATTVDSVLRRSAINVLADNWPDYRALPALLSIAKTEKDGGIRVQALRGYLRILGQDEKMPTIDKVTKVRQALAVAFRVEEKRQALSVLRDCRVSSAVSESAKLLDDPELFNDAANTIIYLASKQRKNDTDQAAVTGVVTNTALDKIIQMSNEEGQRAAAQKARH